MSVNLFKKIMGKMNEEATEDEMKILSTLICTLEAMWTSDTRATKGFVPILNPTKMRLYLKRHGHQIVSESQTLAQKVESGVNEEHAFTILEDGLTSITSADGHSWEYWLILDLLIGILEFKDTLEDIFNKDARMWPSKVTQLKRLKPVKSWKVTP